VSGQTRIAPTDTVSAVLARDESLVDVFVRSAPHFAKLRNRALRRVMARLVTVEQAARTANIPVETLLDDLNAALGFPREAAAANDRSPAAVPELSTPASPGATHPRSANEIELDVRDDLRRGEEPFSRVMAAVAGMRDGDVLHLRAIFEPAPLFAVLAKRGFRHESISHAPDDWSAWFWRDATSSSDALPTAEARAVVDDVPPDDATTTYLDVRELDPPEPMMRTLAALETMPSGHTLVQVNRRVPQFLFPILAERGFAFEMDESNADRVLVRIWHSSP
jgi:hypothetical protein